MFKTDFVRVSGTPSSKRPRRSFASFFRAVAKSVTVLSVVWALWPRTLNAALVTCAGDLSQLSSGPEVDLVVTGKCSVAAGQNYIFHYINIINGGSLQFIDPPNTSLDNAETNLYAASIIIQNGGSLIAGTLKPFHPIGLNGGVITIHLWGAQDDPGAVCLKRANNTFVTDPECGVPSEIWNSNTVRIPAPHDCDSRTLVPSTVQDCFYKYDALDEKDRGENSYLYFGHKVLAVSYGGSLQLFGKKGVRYCGKQDCAADDPNPPLVEPAASDSAASWARLTSDQANVGSNGLLRPGAQQLTIDRLVDWGDGDHIVVTTTDFLPGHSEELVIQGTPITDAARNTTTINFTNANTSFNGTQWPHNARQYDYTGIVPARLGLRSTSAETRAAVALLSRSIRIVSDGSTPASSFDATPGNYFGGHTIVRQGFLSYQIQGVQFEHLGQGGSIGHYPVHFHLTRQAPPDCYIKDSSIDDSMTRWVALHGAQGVTVARVVGYKSIGHGFYLEDGTETNNKLLTNIGIFARAAVNNPQNPRQVPGILTPKTDNPGALGFDSFPYYSDSDRPSVFWIMNGWNDFEYNVAAGAGTCGACYWFVPGGISGPSLGETWFGYASEQTAGREGTTPLQKFLGNSCTSAMTAFTTNSFTAACNGVNQQPGGEAPFRLAMIPSDEASKHFNPVPANDLYWPVTSGGNRFATRCPAADAGEPKADCSTVPKCSEGTEQNCDATVLDGFTTSYNWAQQNFAAVWIRPQWALLTNSVVSDVLGAGVNFVTSGGYSKADVPTGYWSLARKTVFIGSSQSDNPLASEAGPFNPFVSGDGKTSGLQCAPDANQAYNATYCMSEPEGVSIQLSNFGVAQRFFSVYDGPVYQDSNAFLNIEPTYLSSNGSVSGTAAGPGGACHPDPNNGNPCVNSGFMNGGMPGIKADQLNGKCYLPNAAIGWKQPNGFYYAPAFHSNNLFFSGVAIRHLVTEPFFNLGTFVTDLTATKDSYCYWNTGLFTGFTDIDRETVLNDDDGSLTGLTSSLNGPDNPTETISVNNETFFNAPVETPECASDLALNAANDAKLPPNTAKTSPYEYVTTAIYPECADSVPESPGLRFCSAGNWGSDCTTSDSTQSNACVGIPLYRQLLTAAEVGADPLEQAKRMMGQATFQRSGLTVNHGRYYIDTTVSKRTQVSQGAKSLNVFTGGQAYDLFFLYSKPDTLQTYTIYVGKEPVFNPKQNVDFGYVDIETKKYKFRKSTTDVWNAGVNSWSRDYDQATGLLTIKVNMGAIASVFDPGINGKALCQPSTMCQWNTGAKQCQCKNLQDGICHDPNNTPINDVCSWAVKDLDCPAQGCPGLRITLPRGALVADDQNHRPAPILFADDQSYAWGNVRFNLADPSISGAQCYYGM